MGPTLFVIVDPKLFPHVVIPVRHGGLKPVGLLDRSLIDLQRVGRSRVVGIRVHHLSHEKRQRDRVKAGRSCQLHRQFLFPALIEQEERGEAGDTGAGEDAETRECGRESLSLLLLLNCRDLSILSWFPGPHQSCLKEGKKEREGKERKGKEREGRKEGRKEGRNEGRKERKKEERKEGVRCPLSERPASPPPSSRGGERRRSKGAPARKKPDHDSATTERRKHITYKSPGHNIITRGNPHVS